MCKFKRSEDLAIPYCMECNKKCEQYEEKNYTEDMRMEDMKRLFESVFLSPN